MRSRAVLRFGLRLTQPPLQKRPELRRARETLCSPDDASLTFLVSEETATADDVANFRWNHLVPAFVPACDPLENVA